MSISPLSKQFDPLTRQEILALHPGKWSDEDLLKVVKYFEGEKKDRDRAMAVTELILGSPQMGILDYDMLYLDIIGYYRWKDDFPAALRWAYAFIAFGEQHENGLNRDNHIRDLAEICLEAGDLNTGLALFTRLAQTSPDDIWNFNTLSFGLPRAGLPGLALEVLDRALVLTAEKDPEHLKKQLADQRREVEERLPGTPDCSDEISPRFWPIFVLRCSLQLQTGVNPQVRKKTLPICRQLPSCSTRVRQAMHLSKLRFWRKARS